MSSPESVQIRSFLRKNWKEAPPPASMEDGRANLEAMAKQSELPAGIQVEAVEIDGLTGELLTSPEVVPGRVVLHLHGGAFVMGSCKTERDLAARLCIASRARVLLIQYRLAPENPFPAALDDSKTAYNWLLDRGFDAGQIAIFGVSAGGSLAMSTVVSLRDAGHPLPAAVSLASPWVDLLLAGESMITQDEAEPWLTPAALRFFAKLYLGSAVGSDPLASPLYAELQGLPPMLIHVGSDEILLDDARRLSERAQAAGVEVNLEIWKGMFHAWHTFAAELPEGRQAIERIGRFIGEETGPGEAVV